MGKHKTINVGKFFSKLVTDMEQNKDFRSLALIMHLYTEYRINEIILKVFKKGKEYYVDEKRFTFSDKIKLLEATDIIKSQDLLTNLRVINRIRNDMAHTLVIEEVIEKNKDQIKSMKFVHNPKTTPSLEKLNELDKYRILCVDTMIALNNIKAKTKSL